MDDKDNSQTNELNNSQPLPAIGSEIRPSNPAQAAETSSNEPVPQPVSTPIDAASPNAAEATQTQPAAGSSPAATPSSDRASAEPPQAAGKSTKRRNMIFAAVIAAFLLIGGGAAAYVGLYLPNQPENIWKAALDKTAAGYDKLLDYEDGQKDLKTTRLEGDYRIESEDQVFDGKYSFQGDDKKGKASVDVGIAGNRVNLELLTELSETSSYPDIYVRASGVDAFEPLLAGSDYEGLPTTLNNQWYFIDRSLFDQVLAQSGAEESGLNPDDLRALMRTVGEVNREYLFTTDPEKAVLNNKEYSGSEDQDGRKTHRYKVGLNKEQLKAYTEKMANEISQTEAYKSMSPNSEAIDIKSLIEDIDNIDESKTADVWVDAKTKLIRTVRFTLQDHPDDYLDVGLKYTGGDEFPFYIKAYAIDDNSVATDIEVTVTLNTNDNTVKINAGVKTSDEAVNGTLTGLLSRSNDPVEIETPSDARPAMELIQMFMGGGVPLGASTGQPSPFQISTD